MRSLREMMRVLVHGPFYSSFCYQQSVLAVVEKEADRGKALLTCLLRQIKSLICISCAPMEKDPSSAQWKRDREREWKKEEVGEGDKQHGKRRGEEKYVSVFFLPSLCPSFIETVKWHKGAIVKCLYLLTLFQPWPGFSSPSGPPLNIN